MFFSIKAQSLQKNKQASVQPHNSIFNAKVSALRATGYTITVVPKVKGGPLLGDIVGGLAGQINIIFNYTTITQ